jgi:hypothetical protein
MIVQLYENVCDKHVSLYLRYHLKQCQITNVANITISQIGAARSSACYCVQIRIVFKIFDYIGDFILKEVFKLGEQPSFDSVKNNHVVSHRVLVPMVLFHLSDVHGIVERVLRRVGVRSGRGGGLSRRPLGDSPNGHRRPGGRLIHGRLYLQTRQI